MYVLDRLSLDEASAFAQNKISRLGLDGNNSQRMGFRLADGTPLDSSQNLRIIGCRHYFSRG